MTSKRSREERSGQTASKKLKQIHGNDLGNAESPGDEVPATKSAVPSLEQLKNLDSISDIDERLATATRLCDHAHRADMIIRWLLPKLQNTEYAVRPATWVLLNNCTTMIKPGLLGVRLKNVDLLSPVAAGLHDQFSQELLSATSGVLLKLLRSLSSDAQLRQLLAYDAAVCAKFLKVWLHMLARDEAQDNPDLQHSALFSMSMVPWQYRRRKDDHEDSELFTQHCLLPATIILTKLTQQAKAAQRSDAERDRTIQHLQQLISHHVFSRSRAMFQDEGEADLNHSRDGLLRAQISSVVPSMTQLADQAFIPDIFATMLDVAVRCGAVHNTRDALAEVAWYDAVFEVLVEQLAAHFSSFSQAVTKLLAVMKARSTLSLPTLRKLVYSHAGLNVAASSVQWDILYAVLDLNARVFCDENIFNMLGSAINFSVQSDDQTQQLISRLLISLADTFAKDRQLLNFVHLWQMHLDKLGSQQKQSVWLCFDEVLGDRLERYLLPAQVASEVKPRLKEFSALAATSFSAQSNRIKLQSMCVVLAALLRGIYAEETQKALHADLLQVYSDMSKASTILGDLHGFWSLTLRVFNHCLADQILPKDHMMDLAERAIAISAESFPRIRLAAAMFAGQVWEVLSNDPRHQQKLQTQLGAIAETQPELTVLIIIAHPRLAFMLSPTLFEDLFEAIGAPHAFLEYQSSELLLQGLKAAAVSVQHDKMAGELKRFIKGLAPADQDIEMTSSEPPDPAVLAYRDQCNESEADAQTLAQDAVRLLGASRTPQEQAIVKSALTTALTKAAAERRKVVLLVLMRQDSVPSRTTAQLALDALSREDILDWNEVTSAMLRLTRVLQQDAPFNLAMSTLALLDHITRSKPFLAKQYVIEEMLTVVHKLAKPCEGESLIFRQLCSLMTALLKHQRPRLTDRFQLVIPVLAALLQRLLAAATSIPPPTAVHARLYARVLTLLCDPPHSRPRRNDDTSNLVDQARQAQRLVGSHVSILLHSYSRLILKSPPHQEIREALKPGFVSLMTAMEVHNMDCMKVLSSAMTDNERSVLRSLVEEWRAMTKWTGR